MRAGWLAAQSASSSSPAITRTAAKSATTTPNRSSTPRCSWSRTGRSRSIRSWPGGLRSASGWASLWRRDGHIRSAYSVAPAVLAWLPAEALAAAGWTPSRRSNSAVYAKVGASLLVTLAVVFAFFAARWRTSSAWAAFIALGFGLGTSAWPTASQTLWQHESALAGVALAVLCLAPATVTPEVRPACGWPPLGLGIAGAARYQVCTAGPRAGGERDRPEAARARRGVAAATCRMRR